MNPLTSKIQKNHIAMIHHYIYKITKKLQMYVLMKKNCKSIVKMRNREDTTTTTNCATLVR